MTKNIVVFRLQSLVIEESLLLLLLPLVLV